MSGTFIVFEGPDGSGTTTQSKMLAEKLMSEGRDVLLTAEPTDSALGKFIREQLKEKDIPSASALQLLFCADRAAHIETVIKPALKAGKTVICDRYVISTLVYGEALGLDPEWLLNVNTPFVEPDVLFIALPGIETCLRRLQKREMLDVFENTIFQRRVYQLYEKMAADDKDAIILDTSKEKEITVQQVYEAVK